MSGEAVGFEPELDYTVKPITFIKDVHNNLQTPTEDGSTVLVKGSYTYYHYGCDGLKDNGWGCGYRTLQTICSWVKEANAQLKPPPVPTIPELQLLLVQVGDKPHEFCGSKDWIGSFEACLVLGGLYDTACKIVHVRRGDELIGHVPTLVRHFSQFGSPIMMGGDRDCSSKGIMGVHTSNVNNTIYLLVVDPHFTGHARDPLQLQANGWVKWQPLEDFVDASFYNLCLPQLAHPSLTCSTS